MKKSKLRQKKKVRTIALQEKILKLLSYQTTESQSTKDIGKLVSALAKSTDKTFDNISKDAKNPFFKKPIFISR